MRAIVVEFAGADDSASGASSKGGSAPRHWDAVEHGTGSLVDDGSGHVTTRRPAKPADRVVTAGRGLLLPLPAG